MSNLTAFRLTWSPELRTPAGRAKALATSARQAITTSYRGPTDSNGSRVIARCEAKRISVPWDRALDIGANHAAAALQLMDQLGWSERNDLVMGGTREGYVFVQVPKGEIDGAGARYVAVFRVRAMPTVEDGKAVRRWLRKIGAL